MTYDVVDPATQAVENVLRDESVPLPTREAIADAVREELDRQRPVSAYERPVRRQAGLSASIDAVHFESQVMQAIESALPKRAGFTSSATGIDPIEVDATLRPEGSPAKDLSRSVVFQISKVVSASKIERTMSKLAMLKPGGIVFISDSYKSEPTMLIARSHFKNLTEKFGLRNSHLVFLDPDTMTTPEGITLSKIVQEAWKEADAGE
jgi:hypothetical protein